MNKNLPFLYLRPVLMTLIFPAAILWATKASVAGGTYHMPGVCLGAIGATVLAITHWQVYKPSQWAVQRSGFEVPNQLVTSGPYRYTRNPQLLGIYLLVLGIALMYQSWAIGLYWIAILIPSSIVAKRVEEPQLTKKFGPAYETYKRSTASFIPGLW